MRVTSYKYHFTGHTNQQGTSGKKKKSSAAPSKTEDWWYRDSKTEYLHSGWFLCNFSKFGDDVIIHMGLKLGSSKDAPKLFTPIAQKH